MTAVPGAPPGFTGSFVTDPDALRPWSRASGPFRFFPSALARPADSDDVVRLVEWATETGHPLVPRGAGTGMPGHNVGTGVVVELGGGWDRIDPVDPERRTVRVGPGAVAADVAGVAAEAGLHFPPLPSSADRCTIGGMVANNAAGARSFLHGSVREWVLELDVVLGDGRSVRLERARPGEGGLDALHHELLERFGRVPEGWPRVRKNSSGYALDRFLPTGDGLHLLTGSEGTLGIVTSILLRLIPAPAERAVVLLGLPSLTDLPGAADVAERLGASACEYLGRRILEMARLDEDPEVGPLARPSEALLLVELEGSGDAVEAGLAGIRELGGELGAPPLVARSPADRDRLWHVRHRASPTIAAAAERGRVSTQFIEDCVVPREHLPEFVRSLRGILSDASTDAVVFGHAGDGNLHVNPLLDLRSPDWRRRVTVILDATVDLVARLGGTLSGEHGDGRVRAPFIERIWGPGSTAAFRHVKDVLDPSGVMNPGVILPLPGQDPLDGLLAEQAPETGPRTPAGP